jgi:hypothetical protein
MVLELSLSREGSQSADLRSPRFTVGAIHEASWDTSMGPPKRRLRFV